MLCRSAHRCGVIFALVLLPRLAAADAFFRLTDAKIVGSGDKAQVVIEVCLEQGSWNNPVEFFLHDAVSRHGSDTTGSGRFVREGYPIARLDQPPTGCSMHTFKAPLAAVQAQIPGIAPDKEIFVGANWPADINNGTGHHWGVVLNSGRSRLKDTSRVLTPSQNARFRKRAPLFWGWRVALPALRPPPWLTRR